jgi:hypothetical protein
MRGVAYAWLYILYSILRLLQRYIMLEKTSASDNQLSKEDYLIMRAKEALPVNIYAAKSWLITARSLFPHSAKVQVSSSSPQVIISFLLNLFYSQ